MSPDRLIINSHDPASGDCGTKHGKVRQVFRVTVAIVLKITSFSMVRVRGLKSLIFGRTSNMFMSPFLPPREMAESRSCFQKMLPSSLFLTAVIVALWWPGATLAFTHQAA